MKTPEEIRALFVRAQTAEKEEEFLALFLAVLEDGVPDGVKVRYGYIGDQRPASLEEAEFEDAFGLEFEGREIWVVAYDLMYGMSEGEEKLVRQLASATGRVPSMTDRQELGVHLFMVASFVHRPDLVKVGIPGLAGRDGYLDDLAVLKKAGMDAGFDWGDEDDA